MSLLEDLKPTLEALPPVSSTVQDILHSSLFEPIDDLFSRPAKNVRAQLVRAGFLFARASGGELVCSALSDALEAIHAGSLVIDDIQDGSRERRGSPSLHEKYGVPLALNAGNYLYFQPFARIESLELPERVELRIYRLCHEAMLNAHLGQAIDLGTDVEKLAPSKVEEICRNSSRLKTGSLTALALACGAAAGGAPDSLIRSLKAFGENFGIALQRYDDIGNLSLPATDPKRFEDLQLKRPSWAWALAARLYSQSHDRYRSFMAAARSLPDAGPLAHWIERENFVEFAKNENDLYLDESMSGLRLDRSLASSPISLEILEAVSETLRGSYGCKA